jgi:hypothetical protein
MVIEYSWLSIVRAEVESVCLYYYSAEESVVYYYSAEELVVYIDYSAEELVVAQDKVG